MIVNGKKVIFTVNENNVIEPYGDISDVDMFNIYNRIRTDLVDSNIPVIKPIAFKICAERSDVLIHGGAVNIIDAIGVAPIDIGFELDRQIIISKKGGRMFGGEGEKANKPFEDLTFLYISNNIGGCGVQYSNVINSKVDFVIEPDFRLFIGDNKISINVICAEGTGEWGFNDATKIRLKGNKISGKNPRLGSKIGDYFTINTHFNLSEYVKLLRYERHDTNFKFHITDSACNGSSIRDILSNYLMSDKVVI